MSAPGSSGPPARAPSGDERPPPHGAEEGADTFDRLGRAAVGLLPARSHLRLLWLLLLASLLLRLLWLVRPEGALIFDEKYYVNAARVIAGIAPDADIYQDKPLGLDPNNEHPPLAKLLVAASMLVLGDNAFGWRIPSVLLGTASILLLYGVARGLRAGPYTAVLAATLLAFDNLVFVHGRIFTLDIFQLAFMLLGAWLYLRGHPLLAGAGFALAALCKIGGLFGLLAIAGYEALRLFHGERPWRDGWPAVAPLLTRLGVSFAVVFLVLLGAMDRLWVGYSQPLEHVAHIVSYGSLLRRPVPSGIESYPWQWLWNDTAIPYLRVDQQVMAGEEVRETRPLVYFRGAMNPYVLGLLPLGLAFAAWCWWSRRADAALGAFALAWFACTYAPFLLTTVFGQRISYLFYFLPTLPAVALAGSQFLLGAGLPRLVAWVYLAAVLLAFYGYFPFRPAP